jgi:hypothetical protein
VKSEPRRFVLRDVISRIAGIGLVVCILVLTEGCGETVEIGELVKESESVDAGDAESVDIEIEMGAGKLSVSGGSSRLMEGEFIYNVIGWKPEIEYEVRGTRGHLKVRRPIGRSAVLSGRARYEWDIRLNEDMPIDLDIELGAGGSDLDLGGLTLKDLRISTGAGEVEVALTGRPSVKDLRLETGAGDVTVDMTGDWREDAKATIVGGVGRLRLRLPSDVGVRVEAEKGIGTVSASGMTKEGNAYVNRAYGRSGVSLKIDCATGIGSIILEVGGGAEPAGVTI